MAAQQQSAETIALLGLGWIAGNDEMLPAFLTATGADIGMLRQAATDAAFLGSVLDFLMQDDASIIAFCDACGLNYEAPGQARAHLPGGQFPNWT